MPAADSIGMTEPASHDAAAASRLKVFVSYSRTDTAFADELVTGLEYDGGFEVFLDRHSIHEGEEWRTRLGGLIAGADVVVFLLSKASAGSELCRWEADQAKALSKRIVPALIEEVEGDAVAPTLKALNYVRFDSGHSFMSGLVALRRALRADLHWIREHTRLLTRAQEWDAAGRTANRLLTGADIAAAKAWLERRPADAPPALDLHHEYISASEQAESVRLGEERRRADTLADALRRSRSALVAAIVAGLIAGAASLAAGYFLWTAVQSRNFAEGAIKERDAFIAELKTQIAQADAVIAAPGDAPPASTEPSIPVEPDLPLPPPPDETTQPGATPAEAPAVEIARLNEEARDIVNRTQEAFYRYGRKENWSYPPPPPDAAPEVRVVAMRAYLEELKAARDRTMAELGKPPAPNKRAPILEKSPEPYVRKY